MGFVTVPLVVVVKDAKELVLPVGDFDKKVVIQVLMKIVIYLGDLGSLMMYKHETEKIKMESLSFTFNLLFSYFINIT